MFFAGLFLFMLLAASPQMAAAQYSSNVVDFSRAGRPTMNLYMWGTVSQPGIWKVEREIDFLELLTAAQVPGFGSTDASRKERTTVTVFRQTGGQRRAIYEAEAKEMLIAGGRYPTLQEGDLILVETSSKAAFNIQTVFSGIGAVASLALLFLRISRQ